jgi:hypothetical protein
LEPHGQLMAAGTIPVLSKLTQQIQIEEAE